MPDRLITNLSSPEVDDARFMAVRLNSLRVNTFTQFDVYIRLSDTSPYILYCDKNLAFTEESRQRLVENHIAQIYIKAPQRRLYTQYVEQHLASIIEDEAISVSEKSEILYTAAHTVVDDLLSGREVEQNIVRAKDVVKHTVQAMFTNQIQLSHLLKVLSVDYRIYTHSVNVAAYSVALAQRVGYGDPATLREIANGAMMHDAGKSRLPRELTETVREFTPGDIAEMRKHPRYGYDLLSPTNALGEIALDIVLHHHETLIGTGYPDQLSGKQVSPFVRIVRISDVFDAMTTNRPFQSATTSFAALKRMRKELEEELDPRLFRAFVNMMGNPGV